MTMEEMNAQLNALVSEEQSELAVSKENFMLFLEVWNKHPEKSRIVGKAELGGNVIYHYEKD